MMFWFFWKEKKRASKEKYLFCMFFCPMFFNLQRSFRCLCSSISSELYDNYKVIIGQMRNNLEAQISQIPWQNHIWVCSLLFYLFMNDSWNYVTWWCFLWSWLLAVPLMSQWCQFVPIWNNLAGVLLALTARVNLVQHTKPQYNFYFHIFDNHLFQQGKVLSLYMQENWDMMA